MISSLQADPIAALERSRDIVGPALRRAVGSLGPELRTPVEYHFGWCDAAGRPVAGAGGKGLRPALALVAAEAVGGDAADAVPAAVAVELIHAFSLLHDDIIDGDRYRRHRPAAWTVFGVARAIVAGDALVPLAQRVLLDENVERSAAAARTLAEATATMIEGQADDMAFEGRNDVGVEECIVMAARKTGALLGAAAGLGGLLAGAGPGPVAALRHYGQSVGLAFQAVDDLLGIWGDPDRTGKPVGSDLRQGKKTIPVTIALAAGDRRSEELRSLLARRPLDDDDVQRAAALVEECGGRARTAAFADEQLSAALVDLDTIEPGPARDELAGLARFTVGRDR